MKKIVAIVLVALLGMFAVSAKAAPVTELPGFKVTVPLGSHQTFTQPDFDYTLPHSVWAGDVEIMNGPEVVELCEFVPEVGHPQDSVEAELIPVWSDTPPTLLPDTTQIAWSGGSMTDYAAGCNTYCIGTVCPSVPLPASGALSAVGLLMVIAAVAIKSRRRVIGA